MTTEATDPTAVPTLPELDSGVTLLTTQTRGALHSLVLDHLLLSESDAYWVDAKNNATTTLFAKIAPSQRLLDRVTVARGFTAFQHYSLLETLPDTLSADASIVVAPAIDWFYDSDDLRRGESEDMLKHGLQILQNIAVENDLPVLVTRCTERGIGDCIEDYCTTEIECIETPFGPRFTGEDFETLVFECTNGVQTTFAFWRRVLAQRHTALTPTGATEVSSIGTN